MVYAVIMAGGKGERFWPLSSEARPKQLLALASEKTMLEATIDRIAPFISSDRTMIVAGKDLYQPILDHCAGIKPNNLMIEPFGRNTCLAIGLAAIHLTKKEPKAVMVVLPADHMIVPPAKLINILKVGTKIAADEEKLITIGIIPTRAETGYGYIEMGSEQWEVEGVTVCKVSAFKEKPRAVVAQQYYYDRKHLWNSGMFIWSAGAFLKSLKTCQPEMHDLLSIYAQKIGSPEENEARQALYKEAESISVDYAVLEQADNVLTLKGDFVWDDVGSWLSIQRFLDASKDGNVTVGRTVQVDTYESTIYNDGTGVIATLGVSDMVIAKAGDAVLVAHKTKLDRIKELLALMAADENLKKYL